MGITATFQPSVQTVLIAAGFSTVKYQFHHRIFFVFIVIPVES